MEMRFVQVAKWLELPSAKTIFFKLSFIEIDRLPRQARDKHTESSKHDFPSHTAAVAPSVGTVVLSHNQVGKRVCLRHFMLEIIILPRRARDKHTEST
jgi:hypothetical protein